jgi:hypothetical protein
MPAIVLMHYPGRSHLSSCSGITLAVQVLFSFPEMFSINKVAAFIYQAHEENIQT